MPSKIQVDQIAGATGSTVTLPSGQTLDLSSGTVNLPSSALSALNASNLTSGTVPSARLSLTSSDLPTVPTTKGGTGLTTLGTANQVLRVNSGATGLEYGSVSSDFVKLATGTISSSTASISFDGYFTSDYNIYKFYWYNCRPVTNNGSTFRMRFRRSNADVTASSYKSMIGGGYVNSSTTETFSGGGVWNGTSMTLNQTTWWISDTNYNFCGDLTLYDPLGTSLYKSITFNTLGEYEDTIWYAGAGSGTLKDNTNALSGFTFLMNNSNISSGKFALYGVKI